MLVFHYRTGSPIIRSSSGSDIGLAQHKYNFIKQPGEAFIIFQNSMACSIKLEVKSCQGKSSDLKRRDPLASMGIQNSIQLRTSSFWQISEWLPKMMFCWPIQKNTSHFTESFTAAPKYGKPLPPIQVVLDLRP